MLAVSLLIAGCAAPSVQQAGLAMRPRRDRIRNFTLDGRLAVRHGETRYSVNIFWQHSAARDLVSLSGPLGQGLAELVRDDLGARVTLSDRRQIAAADLDQLTAQIFGVVLPMSSMARWVLGDVGAGGGTADRPSRIDAAGWSIDLLDWESPAGDALPTLIEVRRDDIEAKLKVLEWQEVR